MRSILKQAVPYQVGEGGALEHLSRAQKLMGQHFHKHNVDFLTFFSSFQNIFCKAQQNAKSLFR